MRSRAARVALAAAALVVPSALAACSGFGPTHSHVSPAVTGHFKGLPTGATASPHDRHARLEEPWAMWAMPGSIYVMTWGSGSCPNIPSTVDAVDANHVVIKTTEHDFYKTDNACTGDMAVTTSVVRLPSGLDTTRALVVQIDGSSTKLAARTS